MTTTISPRPSSAPDGARTAPAARTPSAPRWPALDGVRGAAVLAVVAWHVYRLTISRGMGRDGVPVLWWPIGTTRFAVDVFFVLSGMLVVQSWHAARQRGRTVVGAVWDFGTSRAARILPAYWLMLVVLIPLLGQTQPLFDHPKRLFAFVTLNQYLRWWLPERVNPVTWSLTTEWHFYVLVPLVVWLLARVGRLPLLAACLAGSILWWLHTPYLLPDSFVFGRLDQFVAGAVVGQLALAHRRGESSALVCWARSRHVFAGACIAIVALGTYHGASLGLASQPIVDALVHPLVGLGAATALLHILTTPRSTALAHPVLRWFGTISFGLYLWHYPILDRGLRWTRTQMPNPSIVATMAAAAVLCALSVGAATASYVFVERPFLAWNARRNAGRT
ncbi:MAG: acyltransferase family protein [Actinomycetota bacterium]